MHTNTGTINKINKEIELINTKACKVTLFNCYCHSFDEAVDQIIKAVACSHEEAVNYAKNAEKYGNTVVFVGSLEDSIKVANILGSTGLEVGLS